MSSFGFATQSAGSRPGASGRKSPRFGALLLALLATAAPAWAQDSETDATEEPVDSFEGDGVAVEEGSGGDDSATMGPPATGMREESSAPTTALGLGRPFPRGESLDANVEAELGAFENSLQAFEREMEDYRTTITTIVESEYQRRRATIGAYYDGKIDELRASERSRRMDALADFERFLQRYPNDPDFTPDVMFRLAELHYEVALDNYRVQDDEYARLMARYEAGIEAAPPDVPSYDFTRTIELFDEVIARFPDYRQVDGALYLSAMCHTEMGNPPRALEYFTQLVERFPDSNFAQESWLRIGEYHFDRVAEGSFERARAAYERALSYGESRLYDKILFKLGWTNYLLQEYAVAVERFRAVLDFYESRTDQRSAAVREEALQYFAISLAEPDWDLDVEPDFDFVQGRIQTVLLINDREYNVEVLERLADVLAASNQYEQSIQVYRQLLSTYPLDRQNPFRHDRLIQVLMASGDQTGALAELEVLSLAYSPDSDWYREQERLGNAEALAYADEMARGSLLDSANNAMVNARELAQQAAETGSPSIEAQAVARFEVASTLYAEFLSRYPDATEAYEARALFAQALFYSDQFIAAAEQYEIVRDSQESDEYQTLAAVEAIVSYERALGAEIDAGRLEARAWPGYGGESVAPPVEEEPVEEEDPDGGERSEPRPVPLDEPVPELSLRWVAANDRYTELGIVDEQAPDRDITTRFRSGILFYNYNNLAAARERFIAIIDACRPIDETGYAAAFLIESYAKVDDLESLQFWSAELERRAACVPESLRERLAQDVDMMAMGQLAERADALLAEGRFEEAAEEFIRLANEYSDNADTASRALFNAGVTYEVELRQFSDAMNTFDRIVRDYGQTEFVDDALVRIAANSKQFFDFDRAISTYQTLDGMNFTSPGVLDSPLLAAVELLEATDRRVEAAEGLLEYVDENPGDSRNPEWLYRAALDYEQAGDMGSMMRIFDRFRREYGNAPSSAAFDVDAAVVDSYYRVAMYERENGNMREYQRQADNVLREFSARLPQNPQAQSAAAEIAYLNIMANFDEWQGVAITGSLTQQQRIMQDKATDMGPLVTDFLAVQDYGVRDWSVCGYYMSGRVYMTFAETVRAVPMPEGLSPDEEDQFFQIIDDFVRQYEDEAMSAWRVAQGVMMQSGVVNECTIDTIRQLNRFFPEEFPLFKQDVQHVETAPFSPQVFIAPPVPPLEPIVRPIPTLDGTSIMPGEEPAEGEATEETTP